MLRPTNVVSRPPTTCFSGCMGRVVCLTQEVSLFLHVSCGSTVSCPQMSLRTMRAASGSARKLKSADVLAEPRAASCLTVHIVWGQLTSKVKLNKNELGGKFSQRNSR